MKKIFILTGEPSGDKLASAVISKLKQNNSDIVYSCVGGTHLNSLGIRSIYNLKEITYIGFTSVLLNIFKIKKRINETVDKIIQFKPDILFTVSLIFFLILNRFNKTLVKPIYVISFRSYIDFMPKEFKCVPPTHEYSIFELFCFSLEITVDANLSPDGSPVSINIFFI